MTPRFYTATSLADIPDVNHAEVKAVCQAAEMGGQVIAVWLTTLELPFGDNHASLFRVERMAKEDLKQSHMGFVEPEVFLKDMQPDRYELYQHHERVGERKRQVFFCYDRVEKMFVNRRKEQETRGFLTQSEASATVTLLNDEPQPYVPGFTLTRNEQVSQ